MKLARFLMAILSVITLACEKQSPSNGVADAVLGEESNRAPQGTTTWSPAEVEVQCAQSQCPKEVGVLIWAYATENAYCTAFVIAPDKIMTAGHCDHWGAASGYFITQGGGANKQIRRVSGKVFRALTTAQNSEGREVVDTSRPDSAVLQLDEPLRDSTGELWKGLEIALGAQTDFDRLESYVAGFASADSQSRYVIHRVECEMRRHGIEFPFHVSESPDLFVGYGCPLQTGNSGSPMFRPGSRVVEAVLHGMRDPSVHRNRVQRNEGREIFPDENHWLAFASNIKCLGYPTPTTTNCTAVTLEERTRRRRAAENEIFEQFRGRVHTDSEGNQSMPGFLEELKNEPILSRDRFFEVLYVPRCRATSDLTQVNYFSEHFKMSMNEWGELAVETIESRDSQGVVIAHQGDRFSVRLNWSQAFGEAVAGARHPRNEWPNPFSVDIPMCVN